MQRENRAKRSTYSPRTPRYPRIFHVIAGLLRDIFMEIFPLSNRLHRRLSQSTSHEIRDTRSRVTNKMVYSLSLCSLFCLLLFTSNSDAVHPSAVYRSFHQNDHFTVPSPNSTLSAQCKAAYDKLRNPNSSDVTELVACKFVRSACVFRYQRQSRVPIHLCHWLFAFCYLILQYKFLPDSTVRNAPGGAGWAGTQAAHK